MANNASIHIGERSYLYRDASGRAWVRAVDRDNGEFAAAFDEQALLNALFDSSHLDQAPTTASLVRRLIEAKAKKTTLDALSKEVSGEITKLEEEVANHFADQGVTNVTVDGRMAYRRSQLWASKGEEVAAADLVHALQAQGLDELTTVNHQSFSAFVRERLDQWRQETGAKEADVLDQIREDRFDWDQVIPGVGRHIKVAEKIGISVRKA